MPQQPSLSPGEVRELVKYFFTVLIVSLIMFGLPALAFFGLAWGTNSATSSGLGWSIATVVLGVVVAYLLVTELDGFLKQLGGFFTNLGKGAESASTAKRISFLLSFAIYFYAWSQYPLLAALVSVIILIPAGFTMDKYKQVLARKSSLRDLIAKAQSLGPTREPVLSVIQHFEDAVKVVFSNKEQRQDAAKKIETSMMAVEEEYQRGNKELEAFIIIAADFLNLAYLKGSHHYWD